MKPSRFREKFENFSMIGLCWGMFFVLGMMPASFRGFYEENKIFFAVGIVLGFSFMILGMYFNYKLVIKTKKEFFKEYQDMKEYIKVNPEVKHFTDGTVGIMYNGLNEDLISDFLIDVLQEDIQHDLKGNLYASIIKDITDSDGAYIGKTEGLTIEKGTWVLKRPNNNFVVKPFSFVRELEESKE